MKLLAFFNKEDRSLPDNRWAPRSLALLWRKAAPKSMVISDALLRLRSREIWSVSMGTRSISMLELLFNIMEEMLLAFILMTGPKKRKGRL
jgi:hypothetical protein